MRPTCEGDDAQARKREVGAIRLANVEARPDPIGDQEPVARMARDRCAQAGGGAGTTRERRRLAGGDPASPVELVPGVGARVEMDEVRWSIGGGGGGGRQQQRGTERRG